jgi:hypothetical protein
MRAGLVGSSDGIGLALDPSVPCRRLDGRWMSRSPAMDGEPHVMVVTSSAFPDVLAAVGDVDLCVCTAGIGEPFGDDLTDQTRTLEANPSTLPSRSRWS